MTKNNELEKIEGAVTQQITKVKVVHVAAETMEIENLSPEQVSFLRNWWNGAGGETAEIPVGNAMLMLDRRKVSHMVLSIQGSEQQEEAK
ncbi:hypothetical protein BK784_15125 [Bacillus thuringiensis serovar medellin]|uniref:Uncharacterized protein n=1 Tax=Bacillus thuringiensis subsp. medellin TaxID=79672 RepID=A0A9X6RGP4_BACTV|nr:hypothetical protein [Bacillus thuringiensis]OUC00006.1 hypothetical protein BK784_15125 [Bacillus thuringiensis serovar medellin]